MQQTLEIVVEHGHESHRLLIPFDTEEPKTLADALAEHDLPLNTRCGKRGLCDGCLIHLVQGSLTDLQTGLAVDANSQLIELRACQHFLTPQHSPLRLLLPDRSRLSHEPQVITDFRLNVGCGSAPLEPLDQGPIGLAIDVGTTTVVVLAVDRRTGKDLARASGFNSQIHLGDNVLTRINLCTTRPGMTERMQQAIVKKTLRPLIGQVLAELDATESDLGCISLAANTTMLHLLLGIDPTPLGMVPFKPVFLEHRKVDSQELGLTDRPIAVHLLPGASAYVGADIVAGVLASGIAYDDGPCLLVDMGTNGEMMLKHGNQMVGCATAAGPAFEGSGLAAGMRAGTGAIGSLQIADGKIHSQVIGSEAPIGICGSAYLDLLAQGREANLLQMAGRFNVEVAQQFNLKITRHETHGQMLRIAKGRGNEDIQVSEADIATLLQAKAAIGAGIQTLLGQFDLVPSDIRKLYLAGGFGMHLNLTSAIGCGLLLGFTPDQIEVVGNTSLAGAYLALLDEGSLHAMEQIATQLRIIELNQDPDFETRYIDQLSLG